MKVVIDTNLLVSALFSGSGSPRKVIDLWKKSKLVVCLSSDIIEEYIAVINRFDFVDITQVKDLLSLFKRRRNVLLVSKSPSVSVIDSDPSDNKFLECAVAAKAKYIISGDKHLLDLETYKGIKIISASAFLTNL